MIEDELEVNIGYRCRVAIVREAELPRAHRTGDIDAVGQVVHDCREEWLTVQDAGDSTGRTDDREWQLWRLCRRLAGEHFAPHRLPVDGVEQVAHLGALEMILADQVQKRLKLGRPISGVTGEDRRCPSHF